jgi:plasmid rolling circle replication initiator protein Rep
MCNWRRSRNLGRSLLQAFTQIQEERDIEFIFLTLTIKNPLINELKQAVKHMNKSFQRMSETKAYKQAVLGHFKALEILGDNTPAGEAHPHFHCLLIVSKSYFKSRYYLSQAKWQEMWKKALRVDYSPSVDVRKLRVKKNSQLSKIQSAVYEVAKYSVKHTELTNRSDNDFKEIINQTYRMRFFATGGILKEMINLQKVEDDLIDTDEEIQSEWVEIEELLYNWKNGDYILTKQINRQDE